MLDLLGIASDLVMSVPDPGGPTPPPGSEKFLDVLAWAKWVALAIGILGIIILGAKMAISQREGHGGGHLGSLGWVVAGLVLISSAVAVVGFFTT